MATESPKSGPNHAASMADGLARLWIKFQPEIEKRMALIETAVSALDSQTLTPQEREEAHAAAHKLAGILGTFGLHRGTDLARQAELLLVPSVTQAQSPELAACVDELRQLIANR
jgi:HPt (histidine-containing phosphotransfer) domain-containing protein